MKKLNQKQLIELEKIKKELLPNIEYKIGDEIYYIMIILVKDTHEQRGNRRVKVRNYSLLRFKAVKTIINDIDIIPLIGEPINLEYASISIVFNKNIYITELKTWEEAKKRAREKTKINKKRYLYNK